MIREVCPDYIKDSGLGKCCSNLFNVAHFGYVFINITSMPETNWHKSALMFIEKRDSLSCWCWRFIATMLQINTRSISIKYRWLRGTYRQTSNINHTLLGNLTVDQWDAAGTDPVGAVPTTSLFSTENLASMDWAKTTAGRDEKHWSFGIGATSIRWLTINDDTMYVWSQSISDPKATLICTEPEVICQCQWQRT